MEVETFVNPGADPAGDGTTPNLTSGDNTHAYDSASVWEAAEETDLPTDTDNHVVNCAGSVAETIRCLVAGWVTSAPNDIVINGEVATQSAYDTSRHHWEMTASAYNGLLDIGQDFVTVNDIQVQITATSQGQPSAYKLNGNTLFFNRCLAKGVISGTADFSTGFVLPNGPTPITIRACVSYDFNNDGGATNSINFRLIGAVNSVTIFNCLSRNGGEGYLNNFQSMNPRNCLSQDDTDGFSQTFGTGTISHNCSDIVADPPGTDTQIGEVQFVDEDNDDYRLAAGDTVAKDNGVDLSGEFNFDFFKNPMPAIWPIGPHQAVTAAGNFIPASHAMANVRR